MSDANLLTCREVIEFLADYLDGELNEATRREFERHLRVCASCVAYLDSYKQAARLGRLAMQPTDSSATGQVPEALLAAIRTARGRGPGAMA